LRIPTQIGAVLARRTEGHIFAFTPEQIGIIEGLRASLAIAVMLGADLLLHAPSLAYGAVAAFWTCLCDPGGPGRARLKTLVTFAIGTTLVMSLAAYCAHWGKAAGGMALFGLVLACGLTRSYRPAFGPMPTPIGLIAAIAVVIGASSPRSADGALALGGCFLLGCAWAIVLCLYLWRTHPRAPARRALGAIFGRLEEMTHSLLQLDLPAGEGGDPWPDFNIGHRRAVRFSIERGRETVARLPSGRARFGQGIDAAGRVFAVLMALGHYRSEKADPFDPSAERPLLEGLRQLLQQVRDQSDKVAPDPLSLLADGRALANQAAEHQGVVAHAVTIAAGALIELACHWQKPEPEEPAGDPSISRPGLKISSPVWRQALRVAVAVTVSYVLGAWLDVSFSYWGTIATLVLMQPFGANTWLRVLERAAGSMVGGVLTAVLVADISRPLETVLFIAPLSAAVIALRLVNYGLFVIFVTPMFVLVSDFIHPASDLVSTRAINEIIGACIGLAGSLLLWPEREENALSDTVLAALAANMAFASGVLRSAADAPDSLDPLRREAGVTSSRAEIARQRLLLQGRSRAAHLDRVHDILIALRSICGAANVLMITRQFAPDGCTAARADRYDALTGLLRDAVTGRGEKTAPALLEADDLGRAVQALASAVQDYAFEVRTRAA
jgi:uncharacterized membrane protein YccC